LCGGGGGDGGWYGKTIYEEKERIWKEAVVDQLQGYDTYMGYNKVLPVSGIIYRRMLGLLVNN